MKLSALVPLLPFFISATWGCEDHAHGDGHDHSHAKRTIPSSALTPPTRQLEWGDINIIHTTDSHGWLLGHQKTSFPEPNYSADLGDFASFVGHMKQIADQKDVDLLLVDSGDLHDGTGLTDGFPSGGVDAHEANKFLAQLPYDIMAIGNHELYIYANALDMHQNFAPKMNGRYLTSNVNITVADKKGNPVNIPLGSQFKKFKTKKGRKVTALGVLYNFTGNDKNTTVQPVANMVKEKWFNDAIKEEPDLFLLAGHMPVQRDNWPLVFNAVRAIHPTTPILILGGHTHIRDCVQLDGRSMSLESGRYMETIGFMSMNFDKRSGHNDDDDDDDRKPSPSKNLTFSRRYLDPNRVTFEFHTRERDSSFDTALGKSITKGLTALSKQFDLDFHFGNAPHDFTIDRSPFPSDDSLLSLFAAQAMPVALTINNTRASIPNIMITNSGSQRFDVYAGAFTKNDQLTASPFADTFLFIPNIPAGVAKQVLPALNGAGAANKRRAFIEEWEKRESEAYKRGDVDMIFKKWLEEMHKRNEVEKRSSHNLTLGYVTQDSCPGVGDDTVHAPLPFFDTPDFIASNPPTVSDDTPIDLVFVDFIETQLLQILNTVQKTKTFAKTDVLSYTNVLASEVLGLFAQKAWN